MDQQQTPINPRLDSSVLPTQPAEDWAADARNALGTTESPSVGHASHVVQPTDSSALDMSAKPQSNVDHVIQGSHSAVSTPGHELPGAWSEKPATANQMLNDAGNALASVGTAAYNALPDSVKGAFSTQTTNTSPVQTTTNHTTTTSTPSQNLTQTAQSTLSKIAEVGTLAAGTAATGATAVYERVAGTETDNADVRKDVGVMPAHEPATLPSQDVYGQPSGVASDGAGALPGHSGETGVAILPDDKAALANKSELPTQHTTSSQPTWTDSAKATALGVAGATSAAAATLSTKAQDAYNHPSDYVPSAAQHAIDHPDEYIPGMPKSEGNTMPYHQSQTLPSQDKQGQLPFSGKMDGVGALPGGVDEEGVAVLPDEKANPNPLAPSEFAGAKTNTSVVDPYNSKSPYSNTDANAISQPHNAPVSGTSTTGETTKEKVETKAEEVKDKVMPNKSSATDTSSSPSTINTNTTNAPNPTSADSASTNSGSASPTKKAGFMDKLKGQSKIISGKMSKNEEKIAEGQALKSGTAHP